jgi:hypothetical protein
VRLTKSGVTVSQAQSDVNGYFEIKVPQTAVGGGPLILSTEADNYTLQREVVISPDQSVYTIDLPLENRPVSLLSRAIVGYDQSGAASVKSDQKFFFDLFVTMPFPWSNAKTGCNPKTGKGCIDPDFGPRNRIWAEAQVSSVPQSGTSPLGTFATGAGLAGAIANLQVGQVAQSIQFLVGGEVRLPRALTFRTLLPSFDHDTKQKFALSLIGSFGAITPSTPQQAVQLFKYDPSAGLPAAPAGTQFVAFVPATRDRFFRQYYGGFRLQTFFFNRFDRPLQRFPGVFDFTYGQNEFITQGHFHGGLFRFDAYWPLPYEALKYVNLFGTFFLRPTREHDTSPLILEPAPAGTPFPGPGIVQFPAPEINRDYYRIGIGIDFISFTQFLASTLTKK